MYNILGKKTKENDLETIASKRDFDKAVDKAMKLKSRGWKEVAVVDEETDDIEYELY